MLLPKAWHTFYLTNFQPPPQPPKQPKLKKGNLRIEVPNNALKNYNLNHQTTRIGTVHSLEERYPHDESIRQCREREEGNGPLKRAPFADMAPQEQHTQDHDFLECIGCDEPEVHGVRVVG